MAELAVFNIAKSLLPQLSSLAKDELLLWYNSKTELEKLENTINTIKDVLYDADQRQSTDAAIQGWLSRLRDEMYKADDLFDSISTRALRERVMSCNKILKKTRLFFSKSNQLAFVVSTAHKVKKLRERLDHIAKDINQFGFIRRAIADERPIVKRKAQTHSYIRDDLVIGRDEDKEKILRLLFEDAGVDQCVSVIAVVGIGGLGKSTLSQLVYNANEVNEFFDLRIWACVNDLSDLKEVLEEVMNVKTLSLDEMQTALRKKIQGKRFLLVLDDVWDEVREHWLRLKVLLDAGERGSKVLISTRSKTVAQNLATVSPYFLRGLSEEHAWLLFKKMAFDSDEDEDYQTKEELGRQIVKKCANVPLAIRTMAGYLYKKDEKQWLELKDNRVMNETRDHPENMIMEVLKISYDDLPSSIKHCFVYCSLFPEDYKFDKTTLIHLWMAQGLLQTSDENDCLEDVGERYFQYLTERCFFHNIDTDDYDGHVECKMHDLFHSLAVKIAGKECVEMKKLDNLKGKSPRHLLVGDIEGMPLQGKGIRSLVSPVVGFIEGSVLNDLFIKFTSLRTLSLQNLDTEELPSSIDKLVHLRYLDLRKSENLKRLPTSLCKLHNLLILRLGGCSKLISLPNDLQKLMRLRYLEIEGCHMLDDMPLGLAGMTSLVMLDRLIVNKDRGALSCLKHLNNLTGALCIELPRGLWKNGVVDAEESMLSCKTKLSSLDISFCFSVEGEEMVETNAVLHRLQPADNIIRLCVTGFPGGKVPDWVSSLTNLVNLELHSCKSCNELPRLSLLCKLKELKLIDMPPLEYVMNDISDDGGGGSFFPSLETLHIIGMQSLKGWWKPAGEQLVSCAVNQLQFALLSYLHVFGCPQLTFFPRCPRLESLILGDVNVKLVTQFVKEWEPNNSLVPPSSSCLQKGSSSDDVNLALLTGGFELVPVLHYLYISECPNLNGHSLFRSLQYLPSLEMFIFKGSLDRELYDDENWGKEGMPWMSLTRLKVLGFEFGNDRQGAHLLKGLHHLTMLDMLALYKDMPDDIDTQWKAPPNVKNLKIHGMNKVRCLNRVLQQLKKLQHLSFISCKFDEDEWDKLPWEDLKGLRSLTLWHCNIKSLSDNCPHLPAIEDLEVHYCDDLTCLPTWVSKLTSLEIQSPHPILKEKCRKPLGSYWPLIQGIPQLAINH